MYIDAHAHIDHYSDELMPQVLAQLEAQQQLTMSVAVDSASYARARMLAERSPWIIPAFGIHPWDLPSRHSTSVSARDPLKKARALTPPVQWPPEMLVICS